MSEHQDDTDVADLMMRTFNISKIKRLIGKKLKVNIESRLIFQYNVCFVLVMDSITHNGLCLCMN